MQTDGTTLANLWPLLLVPAAYVAGQYVRGAQHARGIWRTHRAGIHGGRLALICLALAALIVLGRLS